MKTNKLIRLFGIAMAFCTMSCGTDDAPKEVGSNTRFEVEDITFDAEKGTQEATIEFEAGAPWTASAPIAWLKISPTSGKAGKSAITICPTLDNTSSEIRKGQLKVLVDGESTPYFVTIFQAGTKEMIEVNKSSLTLKANATGTQFTDTITVISNRVWSVSGLPAWLTYTTLNNEKPQNGKITTIKLIIVGEYDRFDSPANGGGNVEMNGSFLIKADEEANAKSIQVNATVNFAAYADKEMTELAGVVVLEKDGEVGANYLNHVYLCSDVAWTIVAPEWIQLPALKSNLNAQGELMKNPVMTTFRLDPHFLSIEGKEGVIQIRNAHSKVLKEIPVKFAGTGTNYMEYDIQIPAYDDAGEDFMFDAMPGVNKITRLAFTMRTSVDYNTIEEAPFHLLMSHGTKGILKRQQVYWTHLSMGDPEKSFEVDGIYSKELYIEFDTSTEKEIRTGFLFIVPRKIAYNDLFADETSATLKEGFTATQVIQKSNPVAEYIMTCEGLEQDQLLEFDSKGTGSTPITFKATTDAENFNAEATKNAMSELYGWLSIELVKDASDKLIAFRLRVNENNTKYNRESEISFKVYRGLDVEPFTMFKFKVKQTKP